MLCMVKSGLIPWLYKLFLAVAERYLNTRFTAMRSTSKREVMITKFELPSTPEVGAIRKRLWNGVFSLFKDAAFQQRSLGVLQHYSRSAYEMSVQEIVGEDAAEVRYPDRHPEGRFYADYRRAQALAKAAEYLQ